jgi:DUF1707 SHOCT-like domain
MARRAIIRAADADREHVAERLRKAAAEGRLETSELEDRLDAVFSARTYGDLEVITKDLPRDAKPAPRGRRSLPVPWPVAALAFLIVMPFVVAFAVAAIVLVASVFMLWGLVAAIALCAFRHRIRFIGMGGCRFPGRAWHAHPGRWRA